MRTSAYLLLLFWLMLQGCASQKVADLGELACPYPLANSESEPLTLRYPPQLLARGISGKVVVSAFLRADGTPERVSIARSGGRVEFDQEALRVVCLRRYKGNPAGWLPVSIAFTFTGDVIAK